MSPSPKFTGTTFANDDGSLMLNEDGTCLHGKGGIPTKCTYSLADGKLTLKYVDDPKKPVTWVVWFDETNKVMHTPKDAHGDELTLVRRRSCFLSSVSFVAGVKKTGIQCLHGVMGTERARVRDGNLGSPGM